MYGFNHITDGVFVGSRFGLHENSLKKQQITHLLSMDGFKDFPAGFITKTIDIDDDESENISQYFHECINFISGNRVLVFCTAGRSRSVTVVAAYLMKKKHLSVKDALNLIQDVRRINPNPGFIRQLEAWQRDVCELCVLEQRTEWFEESEKFVVIRCEQCDLPMVILKEHTLKVDGELESKMRKALEKVAVNEIKGSWFIDTKQRSVFGHLHWHARPQLFKL